jgi:4-hydroxy-2-oxoheptanedioate aldolase
VLGSDAGGAALAAQAMSGRKGVRANKLREIWKSGGKVVNGWCGIPSGAATEAMVQGGWDSLTVDLQHGLIHYDTALPMLQAISTSSIVPLARVPWNEPGIIMKMLDSGAYGIICPMINDRAECERFVQACRYPPHGYRSFGPTRANWYAGSADYWKTSNETVITFAMIETAGALENLDAIMSTPGLDAIYVGPADLGLALGEGPVGDPTSEKTLSTMKRICETAKKHGIVPGTHTSSPEGARRMFDMGFQFATILADTALLSSAAKAAVAAAKGTAGPAKGSGPY